MIGTYINALAVLCASFLGLLFRKKIREEFHHIIFVSIGLVSFILGLSLALTSEKFVYIALSLVIGGFIGHVLKLEQWIMNLGGIFWKFSKLVLPSLAQNEKSKQFVQAFLDTSVLFCTGSLAILGSIEAGVAGNYELLIIKSVLDGTVAVMFASAMGLGVLFSALSILCYQGAITLIAARFGDAIGMAMLREVGAIGGVLIVLIGLQLLDIRKVNIGNFLPAILVMCFLMLLDPWFQQIFQSIIG